MPPNWPEAPLCHHAAVYRRLGRIAYGHASGEEGEHDQRHHQQRQIVHGEAHAGRHAVPLPWNVKRSSLGQAGSQVVMLLSITLLPYYEINEVHGIMGRDTRAGAQMRRT